MIYIIRELHVIKTVFLTCEKTVRISPGKECVHV